MKKSDFACPPLCFGRWKFCNCRVKQNKAGFTLIELIVVIAVLALLAAGIMPSITTQIRREKIKDTKEEMRELHFALREYYKDLDTFPQIPGGLRALEDRNQVYPVFLRPRWDGPYIRSKFENYDYEQDEWGINYNYIVGATSCTLRSAGPDRIFGTTDDIFLPVEAKDLIRAKRNRVRKELEVIKRAAQEYARATGIYPVNINQLYSGGYLGDESFRQDEWGNNYVVDANQFKSMGPDGTSGTGDDIYPY